MAVLPSDAKLPILDTSKPHPFILPIKKINEAHDVSTFLASRAYHDITAFLMQLNIAMFPRHARDSNGESGSVERWEADCPRNSFSDTVQRLSQLLDDLDKIIDEVPPDPGPRRFGNASFRKWNEIVASRAPAFLQTHLPANLLARQSATKATVGSELESYFLGAFGSSQRLDYGTGHELSFLAFLGCIWKLGGFEITRSGEEERGIVLGIIEPYLRLIRKLIKTYTLEPAGSHGVWGLDDHSFLPYIFGSAQYAPAISHAGELPSEGSCQSAPHPADVVKALTVERERKKNMYFGAIGFIYDVKKGPFWEHSPMLFDISGVPAGWAKINMGMLKMYKVEVLSKFPVVQHFRFGSLFSWERQPNEGLPTASIQKLKQPFNDQIFSSGTNTVSTTPRDPSQEDSHASTPAHPHAADKPLTGDHSHHSNKLSVPGLGRGVGKSKQTSYSNEVTKAPWANQLPAIPMPTVHTAAPWAHHRPLIEAPATSARTTPSAQDALEARRGQQTQKTTVGSMAPPPRGP